MRTLLRSLPLAAALVACSNPPPDADAGMDRPDTGGPVDAGHDAAPHDGAILGRDAGMAVTRMPEATLETMRTGCAFDRGAMPWETLGSEVPIGDDIPIRHFIVLMQENRSFDEYFGMMPGVDGIQGGASNPDASGTPVASFHATEYCTRDTNHEWTGSHEEWNDGANDGFVTANGSGGARAMGYLDRTDLPFYWDLAETFALSDHHHCSLLGPTYTNREYFLAATSFGMIDNGSVPASRYPLTESHFIFQELEDAGVSWHIYYATVPFVWGPINGWGLRAENMHHMSALASLERDLASGDLAEVVWIDPAWTVSGTSASDEHPPADPQFGQAWVHDIVTMVMASDYWDETAIILTYDENGGFYDHVPPPAACPPDAFEPDLGPSDTPGRFDRLGFRVPLIVASPYARAHYVSDHVSDHSSILRLLEARYLLPALTARDANAWPLLDMFDFASTNPAVAGDLADAPIDEAHRAACEASGL